MSAPLENETGPAVGAAGRENINNKQIIDSKKPDQVQAASGKPMERLPLTPPIAKPSPYPLDALGDVLEKAAKAIAEKSQCPPAMAAQSVLAVASLAAQRLANVRLSYGQERPVSLFLITIAASGDRKSTADTEALRPVRIHESKLRKIYKPAFEKWRIEHRAWEAQAKKIETNPVFDFDQRKIELAKLGPEPIEPLKPILTAPEPTVEALGKFWPSMHGGLGLFSAEGGQMLGGFGFSQDHKLKTAAALAGLWDGAPFRRMRAGDGITDLPGRRLALHLMIQPGVANDFLSDYTLRDQGLLSRLLIAAPESLAGERCWKEPSKEGEADLQQYTAWLLAILEKPASAANKAGNELTPAILELTPDAREVWITFYDRIEVAMKPEGVFEALRDVAGKAAENAARIAGVLAIIAKPDAQRIEADTMAAACKIMAWYLSEALRLAGVSSISLAMRDAIRLKKWLDDSSKPEISVREILQFGPSSLRMKVDAEAAIGILVSHGWLVQDTSQRRWRVIQVARQ